MNWYDEIKTKPKHVKYIKLAIGSERVLTITSIEEFRKEKQEWEADWVIDGQRNLRLTFAETDEIMARPINLKHEMIRQLAELAKKGLPRKVIIGRKNNQWGHYFVKELS